MDATMQKRIDQMARGDRLWGFGFAVVLWVVYAFVFVQIAPLVNDTGVHVAMVVGAALVLLFNTASIIAMLKQYDEHKVRTYEPDIRHLDEKRAREQEMQPRSA